MPYFINRFFSLSIIYAVFTVSNFIAPPIIGCVGPRISMVIGAVTYMLFLASFLKLLGWLLYVCSALLGFGAASKEAVVMSNEKVLVERIF